MSCDGGGAVERGEETPGLFPSGSGGELWRKRHGLFQQPFGELK